MSTVSDELNPIEHESYIADGISGHPKQLYLLFFTEMWERFSYYGMRALFVLYLTAQIIDGGLAWNSTEASKLYGWYTGLVYVTPIIGGYLADKVFGHRTAIILGAFIMTLGHLSLANQQLPFFYLGLGLLIIGNGLFKPNISSIVGQLYNPNDGRKDGAYTIFYMGINVGAFLGILMCGWLGEKVGWHYGFGCAGVFMFFGMIVFWASQKIFGELGKLEKNKLTQQNIKEKNKPLTNIEIDRIKVIVIFSFVTVFFWLAFEQAGSSMTFFAKDFTKRTFDSIAAANAFKLINTIISLVPLAILFYVLFKVGGAIKKIPIGIIVMTISVCILSGLMYWMISTQISDKDLEIPASWFGVLNSLFIFTLAPLFSTMWEKLAQTKYNPSAPLKFAIGLFLVGAGFLVLVIGSASIGKGDSIAKVSMFWLVFAYLLHTLGELCISPVGLSLVNKLSPQRLLGLMFGIWFFSSAIANWIGGFIASFMERISKESSLSTFFMIFVISSFLVSLFIVIMNKTINRWMHGVG
ncbi:MAG: peptide MFS transporter [Chitinophagales bacterium]|nr:peptide MFS transporter [Chitinophagales bacterium]